MVDRTLNPYGVYAITPELASGEKFLEHYILAQNVAQTVEVAEPADITDTIRTAVSEALGPDAPLEELMAVSSLAAQARSRTLRRPLETNRKALRREEMRFWPPFSIKSIKTQRRLLKNQLEILQQQTGCTEAQIAYLHELQN